MKKKIKGKNKIDLKYILKLVTIIFLSSSPFFDTIFFHSRITTLCRIFVITMILITTLFLYKDSRKHFKYLLIYYALCILYLFLNYYHSKNFNSLFPNNFNYSFIKEFYTILKLMMPITLIYSLYYQKLDKKDYNIIFSSWTLIITLIIIISDIFLIGYSSYSSEVIKYNIFNWKKGMYYVFTACKGYFVYANQVALTLLLLLIYNVYNLLKTRKSIIFITLISISMIILGTRVSYLGGLLTLICLFLSFMFFAFIKKEKFTKNILYILPIVLLWILILPYTPYANRNVELNKYKTTLNNNDFVINNETYDEEDLTKKEYIEKNINEELIPKSFYKSYYSYEYDPDFWINLINNTEESKINYRFVEESIVKRIIQINNNKYDFLLGISNTRIQNVVNLEKDFLLAYYAFGVIGLMILLFIYFSMIIICFYNFFKYFNYLTFINLVITILFCFCAYLTGNIINSISMMIVYSTFCGFSLKYDKN